jgi:pilus assembly protein CpaF
VERALIPAALLPLLEDPAVTDLCLSGPEGLVLFDRGAGFEALPGKPLFSSESGFRQFVLEHLSESGKTWDAKLPFVDAVFFGTHRAHLVFPPVCPAGIELSLRRLPRVSVQEPGRAKAEALHRWRASLSAFQLLAASATRQESILLAGATGSGKTTLFNDLLSFVPEAERLIALEDTAELAPAHPRFVRLLSRTANADGFGAVTLRDLVRQTLRMRPDRILIGECRGDEVLDLLLALNTGHRGSITTVHAESAREALQRLELLALIAARGQIPDTLIRTLIAKGISKVAFLRRGPSGRILEELISIEGLERGVVCSRPLILSGRSTEAAEPRVPGPPERVGGAYPPPRR